MLGGSVVILIILRQSLIINIVHTLLNECVKFRYSKSML